jgi:hypothetical protein
MELAAIPPIAGASLKVIGSHCLLTELPKKFSKCELAHTELSPIGLFSDN